MSKLSRLSIFLTLSFSAAITLGQTVRVGDGLLYGGNVNPPGVETDFDLYAPANLIGQVSQADFGWSNSPCPAAVKIKFFRPTAPGNPQPAFIFLTERGPFDVTAPLQPATPGLPNPPVTQRVTLDPPVSVRPGDIIAIASLTQCGGPTFVAQLPGPFPPFLSASFSVPGDVVSDVPTPGPTSRPGVFVVATGNLPGLFLLGRFQVTLDAMDPRTGRLTTGTPNAINAASGYFSLPDFTGDPTFPEVIVKMVDGRDPALGGTFWFFHAPLTDVRYTLTVKDLTNGTTRAYPSLSSPAGQLCGDADTSAFLP